MKMTLNEWEIKSKVKTIEFHPNDTKIRYIPESIIYERDRIKLWNLFDYRVRAVEGGTIWLIPRIHAELRVRPYSEIREEWEDKYGTSQDI